MIIIKYAINSVITVGDATQEQNTETTKTVEKTEAETKTTEKTKEPKEKVDKKKSNEAQQAKRLAVKAQETAEAAQSKADQAQKTADEAKSTADAINITVTQLTESVEKLQKATDSGGLVVLAVLSFIIATALLAFCLYLLRQVNNIVQNFKNLNKNFTDFQQNVINKQQLASLLSNELSRPNVKKVLINAVLDNNTKQSLIDQAVDSFRQSLKYDEEEKRRVLEAKRKEMTDFENPQHSSNKRIYYAGCTDQNNPTQFASVTEEPRTGRSIFKLIEISQGKCEFEVYEGAYDMVLGDDIYLYGSCNYNYDYRSGAKKRVVTTEKGVAEQKSDGKWYVVTKASVRFE